MSFDLAHPFAQEFVSGSDEAPLSETPRRFGLPAMMMPATFGGVSLDRLGAAHADAVAEVLLPIPDQVTPHRKVDTQMA